MPPVAAQSAAEVRVQTALQEVRLALVRQGQIGANTAAAVLAARARDTDNDGTVEPPAMRTMGAAPAGGGGLPTGTAASLVDGYGTEYGYCAFKNGANFATPTTGLLAGGPTDGLLLAVIFAGPDRIFQTTCAGLKAGGGAQGDDYVATMSTSQTNLGSGISFARPPLVTEAALLALAAARNAQCTPACPGLDPLMPGELRLTLDTNTLWRWDAGQTGFVRVEAPQLTKLAVNTTLDVAGLTTLSGGLNAMGVINLNAAGAAATKIGNAQSATTIVGPATVTGQTTLTGGLTATGVTSINETGTATTMIGNSQSETTIAGPATFAGAAALQSTATIAGLATLQNGLKVSGATAINDNGSASTTIGNALSGTTIGGGVTISGVALLKSDATISGLTTLNGGLTAIGSTSINGGSSISTTTIGNPQSATTIGGAASVAGQTTLSGGLTATGPVRINASGSEPTTIGSTHKFSSTSLLGNVSINTTGVLGTTIGNDVGPVNVYGTTTLYRGLVTLGTVYINPSGNTTTNIGNSIAGGSPTIIAGPATLQNTVTINGLTTLTFGLTALGTTSINATGTKSTSIGNSNSTTTLTGTVLINGTGTGVTVIGNNSEDAGSLTTIDGRSTFNGRATLTAGLTVGGAQVEINTIGDNITYIGSLNSTTSVGGPTTIGGLATLNAGLRVNGGAVEINSYGSFPTTIGSSISNTIIGGPATVNGTLTTSSDASINGLTIGRGPTGDANSTAVGVASMQQLSGTANTAVGARALSADTSLSSSNATAVGVEAGYGSAGNNNVFIGYQAGRNVTDGNQLRISVGSGTPLIAGDFSLARVGINKAAPAYTLDVGGDINASGAVRANGVQLTSDARFKTRIAPLTTALQVLDRIQGVAFDWNRAAYPQRNFPATRQFGVVAQQVETVLPELVATDAQGFKSVNYIGFVPLLIEGLKAQQAQLQQQTSKLADHDRLLSSQGLRLDAAEVRLGKADEALARLARRADGFERLAQQFSHPADDTLKVEAPRLVASNFTAERIAVETLVAQRLEAEQLKVRKLDADELRVTGDLQARRLVAERVSTGEKELFVSLGTVASLFEVAEGAHYAVTLSSNDGSYATATVLKAGGALRLVPTSSQGIELVPLGGAVGVMAASKKVKASWLRTG